MKVKKLDFAKDDFCFSQDFCIEVPIPKLPEGGIMACSATGASATTENPKWEVKTSRKIYFCRILEFLKTKWEVKTFSQNIPLWNFGIS